MGAIHGNSLQRRQLQNYLKRNLAELANYLWAQVQSKSSKKKKNCWAWACTECHGWQEIRQSFPLAELAMSLSSTILYPRMLFFFLAAKTACTPRSWPEVLFIRHLWLYREMLSDWRLTVNTDKTVVMEFTRRPIPSDLAINLRGDNPLIVAWLLRNAYLHYLRRFLAQIFSIDSNHAPLSLQKIWVSSSLF